MKLGSKRLTSSLSVGVIGSGALGNALAQRLHQKHFKITAIVSRNVQTARRLAGKVNCYNAGNELSLLRNCNFIIIAVPDSQISNVTKKILAGSFFIKGAIIVHTSGSLSADVLTLKKNSGAQTFSLAAMHPMQTFPIGITWHKQSLERYFNNIYFGIGGSGRAVASVRRVVRAIGAGSFIIPGEMKGLYHAGGVLASNFIVALMFMAQKLYTHAGLNERQSRHLLYPIMMQTLNNIFQFGAVSSLTGPAARNDLAIIKRHLTDLKAFGTDFQNVYKDLTKICFIIANTRNHK